MSRRRFLLNFTAMLAGASLGRRLSTAHAAALTPTPADMLGPYYPPRLPEDRDTDLVRVKGRDADASGTILHVSGRVMDVTGRALDGALVEIWQTDANGRYIHPGDTGGKPRDPNFQGYGQIRVGADGRYAFRTVVPVRYGPRPRHVHFKVTHPSSPALVTQLYFEDRVGATGEALDRPRREPQVSPLVPKAGAEPGALEARFDIVLRTG